jgi:hypothetical protein
VNIFDKGSKAAYPGESSPGESSPGKPSSSFSASSFSLEEKSLGDTLTTIFQVAFSKHFPTFLIIMAILQIPVLFQGALQKYMAGNVMTNPIGVLMVFSLYICLILTLMFIGRELTQGFLGRIFATYFVISLCCCVILFVLLLLVGAGVQIDPMTGEVQSPSLFVNLLFWFFSTIMGVLMSAAGVVLYFDMRVRKESFGFEQLAKALKS